MSVAITRAFDTSKHIKVWSHGSCVFRLCNIERPGITEVPRDVASVLVRIALTRDLFDRKELDGRADASGLPSQELGW